MLSLILSALVVTSAPASCSWDHPGDNPYKNSVADASTALNDYAMPSATRAKLKSRMHAVDYDEVVSITATAVTGKKGTYSDMRDMHSGRGQLCKGAVKRDAWAPNRVELGLVYCEDHVCVIVPTICNNVSLISRQDDDEPIDIVPAAGGGATMGDALAPEGESPSGERETIALPGAPPVDDEGGPPDTFFGTPPGGGSFGGGGGGGFITPPGKPPVIPPSSPGGPTGPVQPPVVVPPIITPPAIPEPDIWSLLLAGILVVLRPRRR